ncbi:MAG TPA: plasmid transfer protein TraA [Mycobacteriales bacterium]
MAERPSLGDAEFTDNIAIRDYCNRLRLLSHHLGVEVAIAAAELNAALGQIPGNQWALGLDSKARARLVSMHLHRAAEAQTAAAAAAVRAYASFRKHFSPELDAVNKNSRPRRTFQFKAE